MPIKHVALLKTASYCAMHFVVAMGVAYALTRSWKAALAIGVIEPFVQTFFFAMHDRFWAKHDGRQGARTRGGLHGPETHGGIEPGSLKPARAYVPPARR